MRHTDHAPTTGPRRRSLRSKVVTYGLVFITGAMAGGGGVLFAAAGVMT